MKKFHFAFHPLLALFVFILCCCSPVSFSQISSEQNVFPEAKQISWSVETNTLSFIELKEPVAADPTIWLNQLLQMDGENELKLQSISKPDNLGFTKYVFQHFYKEIPVEFSMFYVHVKNGLIHSANGRVEQNIESELVVSDYSLEQCKSAAISHLRSKRLHPVEHSVNSSEDASPELLIHKEGDVFHQCLKFDLRCFAPFARKSVYVDCASAEVVFVGNRIICTDTPGTATTMHHGVQPIIADSFSGGYRLRDNGRSVFTWNLNQMEDALNAVDFVDSDNNWTSTLNQDDAATDVHWGLESAYDYYLNHHSRNSFDDAGADINGYVHFSFDFTNAFWDGTGLFFGDGDPSLGYTPLTSLDVVAHEFTHAVTQYSAGLNYISESGALNESFSDIFGVVIDYEMNPSAANFLIGDMINTQGVIFRDMSNPNNTQQPDTYQGDFWDLGEEVHTNSQVMNYWFYLLCNGGNGVNDIGDDFAVESITMDAAADIAYRTLTVYLTPTSDYTEARQYSIQSAIDLYGDCSNEVIQVTNAWYAVGIGEPFNNAVTAAFSAASTSYCILPAVVAFNNISFNGTSYLWDFGDGTTSTEENPVHTYNNEGVYSITLTSTGSELCGSSDQVIMFNYLSVANGGGPISPSCVTNNLAPNIYSGISHLIFGDISHSSGNASEDYVDNTCTYSTTIVAGDNTPIDVGTFGDENVNVWIDYNNNGQFESPAEWVFSSNGGLTHSGVVDSPSDVVLNTPVRMRVTDDTQLFSSACYNPQNGQTEDYTVLFIPADGPPVADFVAESTVVGIDENIQFYDISTNAPTSWNWSFPGGVPSSSTAEFPVVSYPAVGTYTVTLEVSNGLGTDTEVKTNYILVQTDFTMCDDAQSGSSHGNLFDTGGPDFEYGDMESCTFLIQPPCAGDIVMHFVEMDIEDGYDYITIYDGPNSSSPVLGNWTGYWSGEAVTATSGSVFIEWFSDESVAYSGYNIEWVVMPSDLNPQMELSSDCINFPTVIPTQSASDFLTVFNSGCDTLFISDIIIDNSSFTVVSFPASVAPQTSGTIELNFLPTQSISYTGTMSIANNDENQDVCLTGTGDVDVAEILPSGLGVLYPNPTSDGAVLEWKALNSSNLVIELLDVTGKLEQRIGSPAVVLGELKKFNIQPETNGVHFVRITTNGEQYMIKLVKI